MTMLALDDVTKRFGGLVATNRMSFEVARGESIGLIGPNGAGKTTIFSLIMGEHRPTAGSIRLNGAEISTLPTHARIRRGVSRTYQVPRPFAEMSVAENIRVGLMPDAIGGMLFGGVDAGAERDLALSVGFTEADLDRAADIAVKNPYWNPRPVERGAIQALLQDAWAGTRPA